jgi:hypothetical protein
VGVRRRRESGYQSEEEETPAAFRESGEGTSRTTGTT